MQLSHSFTVQGSTAETWEAFSDIASVAECFPGATVTSAEGDDFEGTCKVRLGPIALVYGGAGSFVERDEAAGRFVIEAKGKDKRGNGTAGAVVTATLSGAGQGTSVEVVTDLQITGKPAQFGRGVIQDVSDKLLRQFVSCLESKVAGPPSQPTAEHSRSDAVLDATTSAPVTPDTGPRPVQPGALDLAATVLPALARAYWKPALALLVVVAVLVRWSRRR